MTALDRVARTAPRDTGDRVRAARHAGGHREGSLDRMSVNLGLPALPPAGPRPAPPVPADPGRQGARSAATRRSRVQSMTTTPDHRRQRHAPADRRADRGRLRHRPGRLPEPGRRRRARRRSRTKSQIPVIADIHFQPKYVFAAIDAGCAGVRVNPGNIRQFDDQVKEIAQAAKDAGRLDPDRRQRRLARPAAAREVRQGHPRGARRVGGVGGVAVRGARLPRLQDLGQAQRPGRHGAGLRAARRARRLAAAPRRHRGRARRSRARSSRRSPSAPC